MMLGFRFDRENGFYGPRRWTFDIDDLLAGLACLSVVVFVVVVGWLLYRVPVW